MLPGSCVLTFIHRGPLFRQGGIFRRGQGLKGRCRAGSGRAEAWLGGQHGDLGALAIKVHDSPDASRQACGSHAAVAPIHPEPELPGGCALHTNTVPFDKLVQVLAIFLQHGAPIPQHRAARYHPGAPLESGGTAWEVQYAGVQSRHPDFNGTTPGVDLRDRGGQSLSMDPTTRNYLPQDSVPLALTSGTTQTHKYLVDLTP